MRPLYVALLLALFVVPGRWVLASQDSESPKVTATPLTNADVLDMLKAGVSQDVVIAKIRASACEFDTTPSPQSPKSSQSTRRSYVSNGRGLERTAKTGAHACFIGRAFKL